LQPRVPLAGAQWRVRNGGYNNQQIQQGYQRCVNTGASDAQRGQGYNPQRSRYYRDAPSQEFRNSFVNGYDAGYRQYSGAYGTAATAIRLLRNGGYRNRGYGNGGYNNQQVNAGYQQGLIPAPAMDKVTRVTVRSVHVTIKMLRTQAYREGFVRGYDEGFRQYARNNNRYRRSNTGTSILVRSFAGL